MTARSVILLFVFGLPAAILVLFGPRGVDPVPPDRTIIRYWEKWTGEEGRTMGRLVDRFNRTVGAEAKIWVDYFAVSNVEQRTLIATAGGDPPDVAGLYDHIVPQMADQGALLPLDELVKEFGVRREDFKPTWWEIGVYEDNLYALPSTPYVVTLYYNKRLFREAGLDPEEAPETIAELTEYAHLLTRRNETGIAQLGFSPSPVLLGWWHWIWPYFFGGSLWDGRNFTLDTSEGLSAYRWMHDQRAAHGFDDVRAFEAIEGAIEGPQNPFLAERLAMVFQGPWVSNWIEAYRPGLDYGIARFPSIDRHYKPVFASADVFVIPRGAPHPREAMTFLAYLMRQPVLEALCADHCKLSPYREPSDAFYQQHTHPYIRKLEAISATPDTFGYPKMPTWQEASMEMRFMIDRVLLNLAPPEVAVREAQRKIDSVVRAYQAMALRRETEATASGTPGDGR